MAKKEISNKHELVKFIKNLYTEEIQLNFDRYFDIWYNDEKFILEFPTYNYYHMCGEIDLSSCQSLADWIKQSPYPARIMNCDLDEMRKRKLGDFVDLVIDEDKYCIKFVNDETFEIRKVKDMEYKQPEYDFKYSAQIPNEFITDRSLLTVYLDNGIVEFDELNDDAQILLETAIKNLKLIFKKDARYDVFVTEKDVDGFRIAAIKATGTICKLTQYFRVI